MITTKDEIITLESFLEPKRTYIKSLKDISVNKSKGKKPLVKSPKLAHSFDEVYKKFCREQSKNIDPTADALICSKEIYYFIEFKDSALMHSSDLKNVRAKMSYSHLCLANILHHYKKIKKKERINDYRKKFITVYSHSSFEEALIENDKKEKIKVETNNEMRNRNMTIIPTSEEIEQNGLIHNNLNNVMNKFTGYPYETVLSIDNIRFDEIIDSYVI
ncbi:hypothetical protein HED36_03135 [Staphylococcus hominis]|uniref:hypothetical protein n=1 Tax=Staphylococcus hominis TaxID=1290 RepID=UPI00143294B3|nr:hypothetical protein [Staphylococcus hominis]NKD52509.1 hypothetical protein [Staphylococcus hominis]